MARDTFAAGSVPDETETAGGRVVSFIGPDLLQWVAANRMLSSGVKGGERRGRRVSSGDIRAGRAKPPVESVCRRIMPDHRCWVRQRGGVAHRSRGGLPYWIAGHCPNEGGAE